MKALPKRKGNGLQIDRLGRPPRASMKALPKRKGNEVCVGVVEAVDVASMKALPKRKGNMVHRSRSSHLCGPQ